MALTVEVIIGLTVSLVIFLTVLIRKKKNNYPPLYRGWIPWFGCAFEFGRAPLQFIDTKRKELGLVFTLYVAGERQTFLMDPSDLDIFFNSKNVEFQKAVQPSVQKVADIPEADFMHYHSVFHDTVKAKLSVSQLSTYLHSVQSEFRQNLQNINTDGIKNLNDVVQSVMYKAVMTTLFGKNVLPTASQAEFEEFEQHFITFDDQFEYGSRLPPFLIKDWSKSKQWLLSLFTDVWNQSKASKDKQCQTLLMSLFENVECPVMPNFSMMLLWASLANAIPLTFWILAHILSNKEILKQAQSEVDRVLGHSSVITEDNLKEMRYVKKCLLEGIRMSSPGVLIRKVVKSFTVKGFEVPEGDSLLISPYWTHYNPDCFEDPQTFNPDRWKNEDIDKNIFPKHFIAFGGGRFQCPGRWFAQFEIHIFIVLFLQQFQCKLLGPVPKPSMLHVVGTQQPDRPCQVEISRRLS